MRLYLRLNKELDKASFFIVVYLTTPNENFLHSRFVISLLIGFVQGLFGGSWRREKERKYDDIGVPDRAREEGPGLVLATISWNLLECSGKETSPFRRVE